MEKVKKLLLILLAPAFVLSVSWILSMNAEFNWSGIIIFAGIVTLTEVILCIKRPQQLINTIPGWMISGTFYAFIAAEGMCGIYTDIFKSMAMIVFALTYFFICVPNFRKAHPKRKP